MTSVTKESVMIRSIFAALVAVILSLCNIAPAFGLAAGMTEGRTLEIPSPLFVAGKSVDLHGSVLVSDSVRPTDPRVIEAMRVQWKRAELRATTHAKRGTQPFRCPKYYSEGDLAQTMAFTHRRLSDPSTADDVRPVVYGIRYAGTFCSLGKPAKRVNRSTPMPASEEIALATPGAAQGSTDFPSHAEHMHLDPDGHADSGLEGGDYFRAPNVSMTFVDPSSVGEFGDSRRSTSNDRYPADFPSCVTLEMMFGSVHLWFDVVLTPVSSRSHPLSNSGLNDPAAYVLPSELDRLSDFRAAMYGGNHRYPWPPGPPR